MPTCSSGSNLIIHAHAYTNGTAFWFSSLPKATSTCRLEEPGIEPMMIEPPTFWLLDDPLYLLSHTRPESDTRVRDSATSLDNNRSDQQIQHGKSKVTLCASTVCMCECLTRHLWFSIWYKKKSIKMLKYQIRYVSEFVIRTESALNGIISLQIYWGTHTPVQTLSCVHMCVHVSVCVCVRCPVAGCQAERCWCWFSVTGQSPLEPLCCLCTDSSLSVWPEPRLLDGCSQ